MNLDDYRTVFIIVDLALILMAATPALCMVVSFSSGVEPFSELWILGPTHSIDYPSRLQVDEQLHLFVGIGNHLGYSAYYVIYVKFQNQTQPLPDAFNSKPSPIFPLYEFHVFLTNEKTWEAPLTFAVLGASRLNNSLVVSRISINNMVFWINCSSKLDSKSNGFYYQLVFELWLYNPTLDNLQYHNRFVNLWLNLNL